MAKMIRTCTIYDLAAVAALLAILTAASPAEAVPAFARKYQTSCQTCHVAYPKLNPFGQAFRLLGYHMPGETEQQVKQPEIPLGSDAYKRVWPDSVWPGAVPPNLPLSLAAEFLVQERSTLEDGEVEKSRSDFLFPSEVALIAAGTSGDHISYFGEIAFKQTVEEGQVENEVEVEHLDFRFIRPISNSMAFNAKIGSFQPEMVSTFDHARRLTIANYDSMFGVRTANLGGAEGVGGGHGHGGGASIALPEIATGFETYGVVKSRFLWAAGLVSGQGPGLETFDGNDRKDFYVKAEYKWGGLALDGSNADSFAGSRKNWREKSFSVSVFAYAGDSGGILTPLEEDQHDEEPLTEPHLQLLDSDVDDDHEEAAFLETGSFSRIGVDFNWRFKDLHLFGAFVEGEDDLTAFGPGHDDEVGEPINELSGTFSYTSWFIEGDLVLRFPWLHGAFRYEAVDLPKLEEGRKVDGWERATISLTGLIRANLKTSLEYTWDLNESKNYFLWANFGIAF
jgi:hypothetical protein